MTADDLLKRVLDHYLPLNDDPETEASVWVPPLPLFADDVPVADVLAACARMTAARWQWLHGDDRAALMTVADQWECAPKQAKYKLIYLALLETLLDQDVPTTIRIGKGTGSETIRDFIPSANPEVAELVWLSQAAIRRATAEMRVLAGLPTDRPRKKRSSKGKGSWRVDPDAHVRGDAPLNALDEVIAAEASDVARAQMHDVYAAAKPNERQKMDTLLTYMRRTRADYTEARKAVAKELGISEGAIDKAIHHLRWRATPPS